MNKLILGRYVPFNSLIHKMDARAKILCLIALMVAIFIGYPTWTTTFIVSGSLLLIVLVLLLISHVSIRDVFKSLKAIWFFIFILLIINVLIPPAHVSDLGVAFSLGKLNVYWDSLLQSAKIIIRVILMIDITMILTATTKPLDLTYALEWYMTPLKVIKFPAHEIAMVISIALRFIPTILEEVDRIMKAQSSRGVDFKHGKFGTKIKAIVSLIIPLFISSFQRADELADSMEARGYDPKGKRTRYRILKFKFLDLLTTFLCFAILAGTIVVKALGL